jgi:hypothetical protein
MDNGTYLKLMPKVGFLKPVGNPIKVFGFFFGFNDYHSGSGSDCEFYGFASFKMVNEI